MDTDSVTYHDHTVAAQWQLLQALHLFELGKDYYSVITLAGAAEEIFGRLATRLGGKSALDGLKATVPMVADRMLGKKVTPKDVSIDANRARNWLKHGEGRLSFDAAFEAEDMLDRAIHNCWSVIFAVEREYPEKPTQVLLDAISRYDERGYPSETHEGGLS